MKLIKKISEMIEDELEGAECYAKKALEYKEERPELAKTFYTLANDEMEHMNILHEEVVKLIEEYRDKHGEPPEAMQAVYDYMHEKQIDEAREIKAMLAMYKER